MSTKISRKDTMLHLYISQTETIPLEVIEPHITFNWNGLNTLTFTIPTKSEQYKYIQEESVVNYGNAFFIVKKINERKNLSTIECEIDLDDFKADCFDFVTETQSLDTTLNQLLIGTGWTTHNAQTVTIKRSVNLTDTDIMSVLEALQNKYNVVFNYDNVNKVVSVIKYDTIQPSGVYLTDELNLKELNYKGDSSDFSTRLIGYGAEDENGNRLSFADINNGKTYVENYSYSEKIITKVFTDERFTDMQSLKNEAIERLKILSIPQRSYECCVLDLAKTNPDYEMLKLNMYDVVTLIDRKRKTKLNHQIVEYKVYPKEPHRNVVTLSTVPKQITGVIQKVDNILTNTGELSVGGKTLNELKRDVNSNTLSIKNTYTKGETDYILSSKIQQTEESIFSEVSNLKNTNEKLTNDITSVKQTADEIIFKVTDIENNGVNQIKNTTVTINDEGISVGKSGSEFSSKLDDTGLYLSARGEEIANFKSDGAQMKNLTVVEEIFAGNLRIKAFEKDGEKRTHIHWI